jgi:hypothetical protein
MAGMRDLPSGNVVRKSAGRLQLTPQIDNSILE